MVPGSGVIIDRQMANVIRQAYGHDPIGPKAGKRNRKKAKRDPKRLKKVVK